MAFGVSPNIYKTVMVGADPVVAGVDRESGKGFAVDYYLDAKSQCSGKHGSCPDTRIQVKYLTMTPYRQLLTNICIIGRNGFRAPS